MNYSKILFFLLLFGLGNIVSAQHQQNSLLNPKNRTTLIIDSIPVTKLKNYRLTGINSVTHNYRLFLGPFRTSDYPSFGISRTRPYVVVRKNAFTHKSLFDPIAHSPLERQSWDNPYGTDSFGVGVLSGSLQLISSIFKK